MTQSRSPDLADMEKRRAALLAQCEGPEPQPRYTARAASELFVTHWGDDGPRVLIVHGGVQGGPGGGSATFPLQEPLSFEGWKLTLPDRPGFGQSPSWGVDDQAADAVWIDELLGEGAHLLGHSWGACGCLFAAARRPKAVRSLVLIEPPLHALLAGDPQARADAKLMSDLMRLPQLLVSAASPADYARSFAQFLGTQDETRPNLFWREVAARLER